MPMYDLLEYSDNYSVTLGSLWNYHRDEVNDSANENNYANNYRINNNKTTTSKYFEYKTKLIESTPNNNSRLNAEVAVPFKNLSNFWRSPNLLLINYEIELDLTRSKHCVISEMLRTPETEGANPADETLTTGATFQINNAKLYVPVVALSINDNINFLENIKQGFKRTISWNKCRSEITTQTKNNNLGYLIDPTFRNINRLFVVSFRNGDVDPTRISFDDYYMLLVEIKDFNALIDNKLFFEQPVKKQARSV